MRKQTASGVVPLLLLMIVVLGNSCGGKYRGSSEPPQDISSLLPAGGEVAGWEKSGELLAAYSEEELFRFINGGAPLYLRHGFRAYAGQFYQGPGGAELEVALYDQGEPRNAKLLYEDPLIKPNAAQARINLGEESRLDERGLFHHSVEFIQGRFFGRVVIQDKTEEGVATAERFVSRMVARIKALKKN